MADLAVLVVSCDKYSDLWMQFFCLFRKYWERCPYPVYLGSNELICREENVTTIAVGDDLSWADNVRNMLAQIPESHVLMLLDDFFLDRKVCGERIAELFEFACEQDIDCLRLNRRPPAFKKSYGKAEVCGLVPGADYYVCTQPAIWKKEVLYELCRPGYSAWDFELKNSEDSHKMQYRFAGVKRGVIFHKNAVERGKYYFSVIKFLNREQVEIINRERVGGGSE